MEGQGKARVAQGQGREGPVKREDWARRWKGRDKEVQGQSQVWDINRAGTPTWQDQKGPGQGHEQRRTREKEWQGKGPGKDRARAEPEPGQAKGRAKAGKARGGQGQSRVRVGPG